MTDFNIENQNYDRFIRSFQSLYSNNPEAKNYLINKAVEGIYGHNSLIYAMVYNDEISGTPLHELLYNELGDSQVESDYFENTIIAQEPYLAISLHDYFFDTLALDYNSLVESEFSIAFAEYINDSTMEIQIQENDTTVLFSEILQIDEYFDKKMFVVHEFKGIVFLNEDFEIYQSNKGIESYLKSRGVLDPEVDYDCDEILAAIL